MQLDKKRSVNKGKFPHDMLTVDENQSGYKSKVSWDDEEDLPQLPWLFPYVGDLRYKGDVNDRPSQDSDSQPLASTSMVAK